MKSYIVSGKRSRWPRVLVLLLIVCLVLAVASIVVIRKVYDQNLKPVSSSQQNIMITVESGATAHEIAVLLQQKGLIRAPWAFEWYVRTNNLRDKLQAGTYSLHPSQSVSQIATVLTHGKVATDLFTILPAQRLGQIREAFIGAGFAADEVDAALNPAQYANHPALVDKPAAASLEGYLYPDSFQKTAETKPETIIRQSLDLMQKHLTQDVRAGMVKQGLTVHQGVIIASIVEQEVGKASDRPIVAQVFLRRIKEGMPLGSDVTAFYGAIVAGRTPSVAYDSPYNTRIHNGLPPGPISNVSDVSLRAVAFPANTDYLYFVAGDDGVTHFSHTVQEHEALTRQYCKKLCS